MIIFNTTSIHSFEYIRTINTIIIIAVIKMELLVMNILPYYYNHKYQKLFSHCSFFRKQPGSSIDRKR